MYIAIRCPMPNAESLKYLCYTSVLMTILSVNKFPCQSNELMTISHITYEDNVQNGHSLFACRRIRACNAEPTLHGSFTQDGRAIIAGDINQEWQVQCHDDHNCIKRWYGELCRMLQTFLFCWLWYQVFTKTCNFRANYIIIFTY